MEDALLRDEAAEPVDICSAIKGTLQGLRKLKPSPSVWKRLMMFTAMVEYDKLRNHLVKEGKSKWPYQRASVIVAHRMGKGKSFARRVRANTSFYYKNNCLPALTTKKRPGGNSLLENEAVQLAVRRYLASQQIGDISPASLRKHLINHVFPALLPDSTGSIPTTISTRTVQRWLHKLGYVRSRAKKGVYVDGHNRPDVVEARNKFLERVKELEP